MKKTTLNLLLLLNVLFLSTISNAIPVSCSEGGTKSGTKKIENTRLGKNFKRTFFDYQINRKAANQKKADDVSISFEDFSNHFSVGKDRIVAGTDLDVTMNIGAVNATTKETWIIPDFTNASDYTVIVQHQIPASETDLLASFGFGTHGLYSDEILERDDLFDLQTDKLTFVGYEEVVEGGDYNNDDDWEEYLYNQLKAPIPLEAGIDYSSVAKFEEANNPQNYIEYTDIYHVIGQGTLQTLDDGSHDAVKAIYKEETREFVNNLQVSYSERYEIIFYSKNGHYVFANIDDPWNNEGVVTLKNIRYQKLEAKTASVNDELLSDINVYPNPITAGATLTVASKVSLKNHFVDIYTINGQKVSRLPFVEKNNNQYETTLSNNLSKGIYFYKVHDKSGSFIKNGKLLIK